jgi:hypothetical protein
MHGETVKFSNKFLVEMQTLNFIIHFYWVGIKFHWFKFKLNAIYEELRPLCTITSVFISSSLEQNGMKCDLQLLPPDVKKKNCTDGRFFLCFVIP